ncbi:MAG: hypothetical protein WB646_14095 [Steroidobacteraceae bacterium]
MDLLSRERTADEVRAMSLSNLDDGYCAVVTTDLVLRSLPA